MTTFLQFLTSMYKVIFEKLAKHSNIFCRGSGKVDFGLIVVLMVLVNFLGDFLGYAFVEVIVEAHVEAF